MQSFKYGFLSLLRNKSLIFWTLAFPIILGTFFSIAFGSIISNTEMFSAVPVAIVAEGDGVQAAYFLEMAAALSQGENALISPRYENAAEAERLLGSGDVDGIFIADGEGIKLIVSGQGLSQSVLKTISDSFLQTSATISNIAAAEQEAAARAAEALSSQISVTSEITLGRGETDTFIQYYYALIALACMNASFFGQMKVKGIQANKSPLAARRSVSSGKKIVMILGDLTAAVLLQFLITLAVIAYLVFALGVNFGQQWGFVVLTGLIGSIAGISYGVFITSVTNMGDRTTEGFLTASSLLLCFLSGLMIAGIKNVIAQTVPLFNMINPAALLSDAFYSLSVYDNYSRYAFSVALLLVISALFCGAGAFILRRKKYDSI